MNPKQLKYLAGFGNEHETEALCGALPKGQFSPQICPYKLYAEQFSSTAFTAPRASNRRTWTYRIRPSASIGAFHPIEIGNFHSESSPNANLTPNPLRWDPIPIPSEPTDFIEGITTIATNRNLSINIYVANKGMGNRYFYSADGEWLFVPQQGSILAYTELGVLYVSPGEILVIPRGIKFKIELPEGPIRGYLCENSGPLLTLPERGPVGANGFANDRDFQYPTAYFEDHEGDYKVLAKYAGTMHEAQMDHSPLDVVAWVGNSAPYKYDLARFNVINTVSFDHPDPSIFTVLTSQTSEPGVANLDFAIFPPRWMVAEHTFRPPWYHRNFMNEFMGLIHGVYDAKEEGFSPGGMSLHNCMTAHGPEAAVFDKASSAELKPERYKDTLAFMFESCDLLRPTVFAMESGALQANYSDCWKGLKKNFSGVL